MAPTVQNKPVELARDAPGWHSWDDSHPAGPLFSGKTPRFTDVHIGYLPDCTLLSALASMAAAQPNHVVALVKPNKAGLFGVRLPHHAPIVVAPTLPWGLLAFPEGSPSLEIGQLAAKPEDGEGHPCLWVPVVEKAVAALSGGYGEIPLSASEVLTKLTGNAYVSEAATSERVWAVLSAQIAPASKTATGWHTRLTEPATALVPGPASASGFFLLRWASAIAAWFGDAFARLGHALGLCQYFDTDHTYAVVGLGENQALGRFVEIYDVRGTDAIRDGADDGFFRVPLTEFHQHFSVFTHCGAQTKTMAEPLNPTSR